MFDLFGSSDEKARNAIRESSATSLAVVALLLEKGVFTEAEFRSAQLRATAELDQHIAAKREERVAEVAAMKPADRIMYDLLGVMPDER
jgi:rhamnogalacturonyl hydrolase YesR